MSPGAFPGAFSERVGAIVQADGGTLLLDEIGELPPETQQRLDRVLATGEVRPVGCNGSNSVDVRVIATSSRPLPDGFRPSLADRVAATTVRIPALRDRSSDIPTLARHLLGRIAEHRGLKPLSIGNDALAVLMRYGWPATSANWPASCFAPRCSARAIRSPPRTSRTSPSSRASPAGAATICPTSPRRARMRQWPGPQLTLYRPDGHIRSIEELEADIIRLAIGHYRGRMTEVARRLGIGRSTLYRKLGELGIDTAA